MEELVNAQASSRHLNINDKNTLIRETDSTFRLNSKAYTSQEIFDLEIDRFFYRSWVFLAHESQIEKPNDYFTTFIGQEPVIVCRDELGEIHCYENKCAHRGNLVSKCEQGNSNIFRCIYHGWSYRNSDGSLIGLPSKGGYAKDFFDREGGAELNLREIPKIRNYRGFIFGALSDDVPSLEEHLADAKVLLDLIATRFKDGIRILNGVNKYGNTCNWKLVLENAIDFYHVAFVHQSYFQVVGDRRGVVDQDENVRTVFLGNGHFAGIRLSRASLSPVKADTEDSSEASDWLNKIDEISELAGNTVAKWSRNVELHLVIFPNLIFLEYPGLQMRVIRPTGPANTEVKGYAYAPRHAPENVIRQLLISYEKFNGPAGMGTQDDMAVLKGVQAGHNAILNRWIDLSRGMKVKKPKYEVEDLVSAEVGSGTDETFYRSLYRWWLQNIYT